MRSGGRQVRVRVVAKHVEERPFLQCPHVGGIAGGMPIPRKSKSFAPVSFVRASDASSTP
jgi:hypothetical protein